MNLLLALIVSLNSGFAGTYFTPLRDDQTLPQNCDDMELSFYNLPAEKFFVGREGALDMGYTFEYPVTRSNANTLWKYFKSVTHGDEDRNLYRRIMNDPVLKRDYDVVERDYREMGFEFGSEGEILEALAIHMLYEEFPENHYYITGSVNYHEAGSSRTIGELDIFVGLRDSCDSVAVGEVKLGTRRMLSKARRQIGRFEGFLIDHGASGFSGVYVPSDERYSAE